MIWLIVLASVFVFYAYFGFPLLLWCRAVLRPRSTRAAMYMPSVSVIIAAYNEQHSIGDRIENLLSSDYPIDRLEIVIASDGSSDRTHQIVRQYEDRGVKLMELPRGGKGAALNAAAQIARGDVLVFSDANTEFAADAISQLMRPLADPGVGGVAGNQVYRKSAQGSSTADGERCYWNYDQWLKLMQSRGGSVTSATGAIYAVRREFYEPVPAGAMDDFFISTSVIRRGFRLVYCPEARAFEPVAEAEGVEFSRKWRVIMQGLHAVACRRELLNPFRYGFYSWQLLSHKVLRRMVGLPVLAILVMLPLQWNQGVAFQLATLLAYGAVVLALACWNMPSTRLAQSRPAVLLVYFAMVNAAALAAIWSLLGGRRVYRWEPERHAMTESVQ